LLRQFVRQADHARQHARRLHDRDAGAAPEGVLAGQFDDEVQALVDHAREGVGRIEADRRQQRPHFLVEVLLDPGLLGRVAVGAAQQVDAVLGQARQDFVVQQRILARDDLAAFLAGAVQVDSSSWLTSSQPLRSGVFGAGPAG
jgi:hypothetical protein